MKSIKFSKNESLSFYAKLLANENLNVVHANIETAAFHSKSKTVILPNFNSSVPEETKVHLASHEVSHFLNPADYQHEVEKNNRKAGILNIIDDCRIEKDIIHRFVGLNYFYKKSYKYLYTSGFFEGKSNFTDDEIKEIEPNPLEDIFINRLNRQLKMNTVGQCNAPIEFTDKELSVVKLCEKVNTWEDVLVAHDEVLKLHQEEMKNNPEKFSNGDPLDEYDPLNTSDMTDENIKEVSLEDFIEMLENGQISKDDIIEVKRQKYDNKKQSKKKKSKKSKKNNENKSTFDLTEKFEKSLESKCYEVNFDKVDLKLVDDYKQFNKVVKSKENIEVKSYLDDKRRTIRDMVLIFNRLKNAKQKLNQKRSEYGDINYDKVIHYKTEEKIFKSNIIKSKQKNHGFVMFLDFSGSMDSVLDSLSDQVIRLCEFCYKVNIPYRVYLFTSGWGTKQLKSIPGINPASSTKIIEALSSENPDRMKAYSMFKNTCLGETRYSSGGTPIYSSLLYVPKLLSEFQSKYKVDKINLFVFTDGEDNDGMRYNGKTLSKFGRSTLNFKGIRAEILEAPECYFDQLNIFYQMYKKLFDINITTFFMDNNPKKHFNKKVKAEYNSDKELFKTDEWGDQFFTMGEDYFKDVSNDSLFVKVLMKDII